MSSDLGEYAGGLSVSLPDSMVSRDALAYSCSMILIDLQ